MRFKSEDLTISLSLIMDNSFFISMENTCTDTIESLSFDFYMTDADNKNHQINIDSDCIPKSILPGEYISFTINHHNKLPHAESPVVIANENKTTKHYIYDSFPKHYDEIGFSEYTIPYYDVETEKVLMLKQCTARGCFSKKGKPSPFSISLSPCQSLYVSRIYYSDIITLPYELTNTDCISINPVLSFKGTCYSIDAAIAVDCDDTIIVSILDSKNYPDYINNVDAHSVIFSNIGIKLINPSSISIDFNPMSFIYF